MLSSSIIPRDGLACCGKSEEKRKSWSVLEDSGDDSPSPTTTSAEDGEDGIESGTGCADEFAVGLDGHGLYSKSKTWTMDEPTEEETTTEDYSYYCRVVPLFEGDTNNHSGQEDNGQMLLYRSKRASLRSRNSLEEDIPQRSSSLSLSNYDNSSNSNEQAQYQLQQLEELRQKYEDLLVLTNALTSQRDNLLWTIRKMGRQWIEERNAWYQERQQYVNEEEDGANAGRRRNYEELKNDFTTWDHANSGYVMDTTKDQRLKEIAVDAEADLYRLRKEAGYKDKGLQKTMLECLERRKSLKAVPSPDQNRKEKIKTIRLVDKTKPKGALALTDETLAEILGNLKVVSPRCLDSRDIDSTCEESRNKEEAVVDSEMITSLEDASSRNVRNMEENSVIIPILVSQDTSSPTIDDIQGPDNMDCRISLALKRHGATAIALPFASMKDECHGSSGCSDSEREIWRHHRNSLRPVIQDDNVKQKHSSSKSDVADKVDTTMLLLERRNSLRVVSPIKSSTSISETVCAPMRKIIRARSEAPLASKPDGLSVRQLDSSACDRGDSDVMMILMRKRSSLRPVSPDDVTHGNNGMRTGGGHNEKLIEKRNNLRPVSSLDASQQKPNCIEDDPKRKQDSHHHQLHVYGGSSNKMIASELNLSKKVRTNDTLTELVNGQHEVLVHVRNRLKSVSLPNEAAQNKPDSNESIHRTCAMTRSDPSNVNEDIPLRRHSYRDNGSDRISSSGLSDIERHARRSQKNFSTAYFL